MQHQTTHAHPPASKQARSSAPKKKKSPPPQPDGAHRDSPAVLHRNGIPYVEAYRPSSMQDIVLDPLTRDILDTIVASGYFPNMLFYGPPGTGKTTTIINLIHAYQARLGAKNKDLVIHLNASDERGIDIIRNQINCFVNTKPLFNHGMKFVILDEVDYMTKTAQQALRYLLQNYTGNVRFCLICNYISKVDEGLQNEFMRLQFNRLPKDDIVGFLRKISASEQLDFSDAELAAIQTLYKSDLRSMINFMQSNQNMAHDIKIIDQGVWDTLFRRLAARPAEPVAAVHAYIQDISVAYNIDKKNIMKFYVNYVIKARPQCVTPAFLSFAENLLHAPAAHIHRQVLYFVVKLQTMGLSDPPSETGTPALDSSPTGTPVPAKSPTGTPGSMEGESADVEEA